MTYYIELNGKVLNAIREAGIENTELTKKFKDNLIPIGILDKASELNLKDKFCNVDLQYTWFCLNRQYAYRKFKTGWKKFKISFSDTFVENSEKNKRLVLEAYNLCPKPKSKIFSKISGKHYISIRQYISGKVKIPLSLFLKSCQLLNKDPWKELDNCKLYSGSSKRSRFIIFQNKINPEIEILLNWINLEGNLDLSRPTISISQNKNEKLCFEKLINYLQEVFKLPKDSMKLQRFRSRPNISILTIYSAPLRQLLNLRYKIPLGYKSREVKPTQVYHFDKENTLKILASEIETEGSFARHRKYNITHCEVSFSTYSKDYSKFVFNKLKKMGYPVSFIASKRERQGVREVEYKVTFWGTLEIQRFAYWIMPYFHHLGKINKLIEVIKQKDYLKITRIAFNDKIKKLIYKAKNKCGNFRLLALKLNKDGLDISHEAIEGWIYQSQRVSVYAILKLCSIITEKNYFKYIPKELALSLWLQGFIDRNDAERLRGLRDCYKHMEI